MADRILCPLSTGLPYFEETVSPLSSPNIYNRINLAVDPSKPTLLNLHLLPVLRPLRHLLETELGSAARRALVIVWQFRPRLRSLREDIPTVLAEVVPRLAIVLRRAEDHSQVEGRRPSRNVQRRDSDSSASTRQGGWGREGIRAGA